MRHQINDHIKLAIQEDIPNGDITSLCLGIEDTPGKAIITAKEAGLFYGETILQHALPAIDTSLTYSLSIKDGQPFIKGQNIAYIHGPYASLLKAERIVLNFLQRLCGVATTAHAYVNVLDNANIKILDTRKTTPGFRYLEKEAVKAGGAHNHRQNLSDMVLIKENHLSAYANEYGLGSLGKTLHAFKTTHPDIKIEIEIETLDQLRAFPLEHADYIMFDNFPVSHIQNGIDILNSRNITAEIELSGGITLETLHQYRQFNIHRISVGALTHSVKAIDLSLCFLELSKQT